MNIVVYDKYKDIKRAEKKIKELGDKYGVHVLNVNIVAQIQIFVEVDLIYKGKTLYYRPVFERDLNKTIGKIAVEEFEKDIKELIKRGGQSYE